MPKLETTWDYAEYYIGLGWYIGPTYWIDNKKCACAAGERCRSAAKHPTLPNGFHGFTNDIEKAKEYWKTWPKAGIGVDLERSGVLFVGPDSPAWKEKFEQKGFHHGAAIMDSGGGEGHVHYYFKRPDGCPTTRINRPEEFDIQAAGIGVLPPSPHISGKTRTWQIAADQWLPDAPREIIEQLRTASENRIDVDGLPPLPTVTAPTELPVRLSQEGIERWVGSKVDYHANSMRVDVSLTIHNMARELAKAGATKEVIYSLLQVWALTQGYAKYANRPIEYWRSAVKAVDEVDLVPEAAPESDDLKIWSLAELMTTKFEKPLFFIEPLIPSTGITLIAAESGALKTWAVLSLTVSALLGEKWLGHYELTTSCDNILVLDGELGVELAQSRFQKLGAPISENLDYIFRQWRIEVDAEFNALMSLAQQKKYSVIIVDSLSTMHSLEERTDTTLLVMKRLRQIADAAKCPMVLVAHFGKPIAGSKTSLLNRIRGPSPYRDKASSILTLRRFGDRSKELKARFQHQKNWAGIEGAARTLELIEKDGRFQFVSEVWEVKTDTDEEPDENQKSKVDLKDAAEMELYVLIRGAAPGEEFVVADVITRLRAIGISKLAAETILGEFIAQGKLSPPVRRGLGGRQVVWKTEG